MKSIEIVAIEQRHVHRDQTAPSADTADRTALTVSRGDFVVLLDRNGAGRSTLVKLRNALLPPTEATVSIQSIEPRTQTKLGDIPGGTATIFQDPESQIIGATVAEDAAFGPENLGLAPQAIRDRVRHALQAVALEDLRDAATHLLTGTQKLRLVLAGALALEPECLLVDKATALLDGAGRKEFAALLHSLNRDRGLTVVQVTDDPEEAVGADRVIVWDDGEITLDGTPAQVLATLPPLAKAGPGLPQAPRHTDPGLPQAPRRTDPGPGAERPSPLAEMTALHYLPGESILHRTDPRTKLVLTLAVMAAVFLLQSFPALLLLLAIMLALACSAGKPLRRSLRGLKPVLYLSLVAVAVNLASIKGTPLIDQGLLRHLSREALLLSATMLLRVVLLASAASLLTLTTTPFALADGLARLLRPLQRFGVPVSETAMMLLIALRFMPLIVDEAQRVLRAQAARSGDFNRGSLLQRGRSYLPLFIPLFAGVARRGDALATAMDARCYRGSKGRTRMNPLQFCASDLACLAGTTVVLSMAALVERL